MDAVVAVYSDWGIGAAGTQPVTVSADRVLCRAAEITGTTAGELTDGQLSTCAALCKQFPLNITGTGGFDSAQVTAGGIVTAEFNPHTMESRKVPGLYACGEVLDIDGDCGGYNLQWAWSSGRLAGELNHD